MKTSQNRMSGFPLKVEANLGGKKVCKRPAYHLAYCLLTLAYRPAYLPAYLQATGVAGSRVMAALRLVLCTEKIVRHSASCSFFQNRYETIYNG